MKIIHFYHFDSDPRFPPFLLYVRWKSGVTFVRRCFRDVINTHWKTMEKDNLTSCSMFPNSLQVQLPKEQVYFYSHKTRAAFSRRSQSVQGKCRKTLKCAWYNQKHHRSKGKCRKTPRCAWYNQKHHRSNTVASPVDPVGSHSTPSDGAHFEHVQNKRHHSV